METKQTAVEWLWHHFNVSITKPDNSMLEQAKEMEKEQMRIIYNGLLQNIGTYVIQSDLLNFEQYYNKTYNK